MSSSGDAGKVFESVKPLLRAGTVVQLVRCGTAETSHLRGGAGGSHLRGVPYLEEGEQWPSCAHELAMSFLLQIDTRDALHAPRASGVYVVYECNAPIRDRFAAAKAGDECLPVVRHYARASAERRRSIPIGAEEVAHRLVPTRQEAFLPEEHLLEVIAPEIVNQLSRLELSESWGRAYWRLTDGNGMRKLLFEEHFGGWHQSYPDRLYMPPACPDCGELAELVAQLEAGDWWTSIWACSAHPAQAHFARHK